MTIMRTSALIVACVFVTGCGPVEANVNTGDEFDNEELVEFLEEDVERETDTAFDVTCPKDIKQKDGATFDCTGVDSDDYEVTIRATQTNDDGGFEWEIVEDFNADLIEESITTGLKEQTSIDFDVTCPEDVEMAVGAEYDCVATAPDGTETTITTSTNEDGDIDWEPVTD